MIDRSHELALVTQARLLGVARSTAYRAPLPVSASDLAMMRRIAELQDTLTVLDFKIGTYGAAEHLAPERTA